MSLAQHRQRGGDLAIVETRTMATIPRGDREELRVEYVRARTGDGRDVAWHGLREYYCAAGGEMRPGQRGITIRARELRPVVAAMIRTVAGTLPSELRAAAAQIVAALDGARRA